MDERRIEGLILGELDLTLGLDGISLYILCKYYQPRNLKRVSLAMLEILKCLLVKAFVSSFA